MNIEPNSMVDIVGIVKSAGEMTEITLQKQGGRQLQKRELMILDETQNEVRLTLWGEKAMNNVFNWDDFPIVAFKNLKVSDYSGRSVGATSGTSVVMNPDPEGNYILHEVHVMITTVITVIIIMVIVIIIIIIIVIIVIIIIIIIIIIITMYMQVEHFMNGR